MTNALQQFLNVKTSRTELAVAPEAASIVARTRRAEALNDLQGVCCFAAGTVDVLTRDGWLPIEEVEIDTEVLSKRVGDRQAFWDRPLEVVDAPYEGPMVEYRGRFLNFLVTPCHKFEYERRQSNKLVSGNVERWVPEVRAITDMQRVICRIPTTFTPPAVPSAPYVIPAHASLRYGTPLATRRAAGQVAVTEREAISVDAGDWAELVGWYLAEGSIGRARGNPATVSIGQSREKNRANCQRIADLIERLGFRPSNSRTAVTLCSVQVARHMAELCPGHSHEKRVPPFVFELPAVHIRRLLDGLRLGDGYGDHDYHTSSPGLAQDAQRLILLAGGYASINVFARKGTLVTGFAGKEGHTRNGDYYRTREWRARSVDTALIRPEKRVEVPFAGRVSCLRMTECMFYVRDRASTLPFWTHNSSHVPLVAEVELAPAYTTMGPPEEESD